MAIREEFHHIPEYITDDIGKYIRLLNEGINDPTVFIFVFMEILVVVNHLYFKKLGFGSMGLRPVNSDQSFEMGLKK